MDYGSVGIFPFDLMNKIFLQTSIQAAVSIYLSCKYWRDKYEHIINHDTIVLQITTGYYEASTTAWHTFKNGCVSFYCGKNRNKTTTQTSRGFFSSVQDLVNFLNKFQKIITDSVQEDGKSEIQRVLLRTTSSNGISRYFGRANDLYSRLPTCKGVQELSQQAMEELRKLMNEIKYEYVASKVMDEDFRSLMSNFFIRINVRHRRLSSDMDDHDIIVKLNRQGDCNLKIGQHESWIRTSPMVYQEIVEIAKKSQFKTSIAWNVRNYRDHRMAESFELALKDNNEWYYIQEYKIKKRDGSIRVENNGCETATIIQVLKALERIIQHKSLHINPFLKETIILPPPDSFAYPLARFQHYCIPMYGFPIVLEFRMGIRKGALSRKRKYVDVSHFFRYSEKALPIEEITELLLFIEQNMDYRKLPTSTRHSTMIIHMTTEYDFDNFKVHQKAVDKVVAFVKKYKAAF